MKKKIISAVIAACLLLSSVSAVFAEPSNSGYFETNPQNAAYLSSASKVFPIPESFDKVAENSNYIFYADKKNGEIAVTVKANGYNWFSNPQDRDEDTVAGGEIKKRLESQLVIYYTQGSSASVTNSATGCVSKKGLKSSKIDNGIKFTYEFKNIGFTIPVQYVLTEQGLEAQVMLEEIDPPVVVREEGSKDNKYEVSYYLTKIDFLPFFGAAGTGENGYMFIPEGAGALINLNNGKTDYASYSSPIYGQYKDLKTMTDLTNNLVKMPVYGLRRGNNAFFAIVEENEALGYINAAVSGRETSFNTVYSTIQHRTKELVDDGVYSPVSEPMTTSGNYKVFYNFLTGDKSAYEGMAECYQNYLVNNGMEKHESAQKSEMYIETYAGVDKKTSVFGIVRKVLEPMSTYKGVQEMSQKYLDSGVDNLVVKYMGWTRNKDRKEIKTSVKHEGKLGGKSDFKKLVNFANQNNVSLYPSMNFVKYSDGRTGYSPIFDAAKSPDQSPAYQSDAMHESSMYGRRWSLLKPNKAETASDDFLKSYKKTNVGAISLEDVGNTVYADNTKDGVKRSQTVDAWENILKNYKDNVGAVMVDDANAYTFVYADRIADVQLNEYGNELIDENVPFYQMVLHGYISYSTPSINLTGDWGKSVLRAVETGSNLKFTLMKENTDSTKDTYLNTMYSCDFDTWFEKTVEEYKRVSGAAKETAGKRMIGHSKIADDVYETIYEGNVRTVVNYNDNAVDTEYGTVEGLDFILVK